MTNAPPVVAMAASATGGVGTPVSFTFTAADPGSADQAAGFAWMLDFGDGTTVLVPAGTLSPLTRTHAFANAGTYTITATATDKDGGVSAPVIRPLSIVNGTPPVVAAHADVTVEATSLAGAVVIYDPGTATGSGTPVLSYSKASGALFPLGVTVVTITATDTASLTGTGTFTVKVLDTTAHAVSVPADSQVRATSPSGAAVSFVVTASDAVGVTSLVSTPASGSLFPNGQTTVTVTAKDAANNAKSSSFTITVTPLTAAENWRYTHFGSTDPAVAAADPDGNGKPKLLEVAFVTDPSKPGSGAASLEFNGTFAGGGAVAFAGQPIIRSEEGAAGTDTRALFVRRTDYAAAGLIYSAEFSADLATWSASTAVPTVLADDGNAQIVSVPYPPTVGGQVTRFFRVNVTLAP